MTLTQEDLKLWLETYHRHREMFVRGATTWIEASDALRNLRFRDEALRVELFEWQRAKDQRAYRYKKQAIQKLEKHFEQAGTTPPSSV